MYVDTRGSGGCCLKEQKELSSLHIDKDGAEACLNRD